MQTQVSQTASPVFQKQDEKILVVKRTTMFQKGQFQGFLSVTNFADYEQLIEQNKEFLWRSQMEVDPTYKQIIPYLVFSHENKYFLMRRRSDASEVRLQNKCSLGIGGHVREEDLTEQSLIGWARREFAEEVHYDGALSVKPIGLLNDDSNAVGQVHIGFVFLLEGDKPSISIKSELKEGQLLTLDEMKPLHDQMETWSQLVFDYLRTL